MAGPLSGIRIVDFSRVLAGPLVRADIAGSRCRGHQNRAAKPGCVALRVSVYRRHVGLLRAANAGKRNVSINLNVPGAYELVLKLCDTADIVVENFRAGTLGFFGLDYETLSKRNPRLIYASITGYGQGGPWRSRMAYAPTVQAEAASPRTACGTMATP